MKCLIASILVCTPSLVMAQPQALVTIGGERGVELGAIVDVKPVAGRLVILDKNAPHLRLLNERGELLQTTGRRGSGPGEFAVPFSLSVDSSTRAVLVVDPANARVTKYVVDDTLRLTGTIPTSVVNLRYLCLQDGRFFGVSSSKTQLLDELELREERLVSRRAMGRPQSSHPLAAHPMVVGRTSDGPLQCDGSGHVWATSRVLGEIHRVSVDGNSQQTQSIQDFHPIRLQAEGGGGLSFSMPEDGWYEEISSLLPTESGVRVVLSRFNRDGAVTGYQFVDVSSDFRAESARVTAQWRQTSAVARGAVCVVNDPVPTVAIFAGTRCP